MSQLPVSDAQPKNYRPLVAMYTIARREVSRIMRIWKQTLVPPAITMTLYFLIFGSLIGKRIGEMDGLGYMDFIVPGLLMMSVIQNAYGNVASSFFGSKFSRFVEEMLVSPMPSWVMLSGYVVGGMLRGIMVGCIVFIIATLFTNISIQHPLVFVVSLLLGSAIFSIGGFLNALFAQKFDDISIIPTFILTPLTYLGGVFYTIDMLPDWAEKLSYANPILYIVNAFRFGMHGQSDVAVGTSFVVMALSLILLGGLAMWLIKRGYGLRH